MVMDDLRCTYCDKEFKYESEKKRHELSHSPRFQCEICNKKFSFISALRRHEKQHQRAGTVQCKQCHRRFRDDSLLKRHIDYAHKGKYLCDICNREFHSELALSTHKKIHKAKSERKYRCCYNGCEKTFNFRHHLKHHESTHTNFRQHCCPKCNRGFIQYQHLKSHMKIHEPEKWLPCTVAPCKKKFATEYSRKRHILSIHSKNIGDHPQSASVSEKVNTVLCTNCGELVDEYLYQEHINSNHSTGAVEKPEDLTRGKREGLDENTGISNHSPDIIDCKSAIGHCIINTESGESCLCAQIKTTVNDYCDNALITNKNINTTNIDTNLEMIENESFKVSCQDCKCNSNIQYNYLDHFYAGKNSSKQCLPNSDYNAESKVLNNIPVVEYTTGGIIKLKETFDSDIDLFEKSNLKTHENEMKISKSNCVPYNSCKAVLGKCIVSGNGTIGEGCLCAKMLTDDQYATDQEIDEITPHPVVSRINSTVI